MKRSCNECKALDTFSFPNARCGLGFRIQGSKEYEGITVAWKPLEECPKPETQADFCYISNLKMKGKLV